MSEIFFFNTTATTDIYTLSLHDALPISDGTSVGMVQDIAPGPAWSSPSSFTPVGPLVFFQRSEEHTSELQSHSDLVCRLLLEKKKRSACRPCQLSVWRCSW